MESESFPFFLLTSRFQLNFSVMNKIGSTFFALLFFVSLLPAQNVVFGAKAGGNLATLTGNSDFEYKFGAQFGAVANIALSLDFSLQPELFYSAQGYRRNENGVRETGKIDYFNLPVLINFRVAEGFSLQAGPQLGVNIRNEREVEGGIGDNTALFINDIDFSAALGLQYFFDASFFAQARYTFGLSEVVRNLNQRHSVISLSFGFFFDTPQNALLLDED